VGIIHRLSLLSCSATFSQAIARISGDGLFNSIPSATVAPPVVFLFCPDGAPSTLTYLSFKRWGKRQFLPAFFGQKGKDGFFSSA